MHKGKAVFNILVLAIVTLVLSSCAVFFPGTRYTQATKENSKYGFTQKLTHVNGCWITVGFNQGDTYVGFVQHGTAWFEPCNREVTYTVYATYEPEVVFESKTLLADDIMNFIIYTEFESYTLTATYRNDEGILETVEVMYVERLLLPANAL